MNTNPWQVDSIEAFTCLKCPECNFYSREENYFKDHALSNHPCSVVFFGKHEEHIALTPEEYKEKFNKRSNLDETSSYQIKVEIKQEIVEDENKLNDSEFVGESYEDLNRQEEIFEHDPSGFNDDIDLDFKSNSETTIIRNHPYRCSLCNKGYAQKQLLFRHFKTVHGEDSIQFKCSTCNKKFPEMQTLIEHNASVHEQETNEFIPSYEGLVDESFDDYTLQDPFKDTNNSEVKDVRLIHEGEKPVQCSICSESFKSKKLSRSHILHQHKREAPHLCSICDANFSQKSKLNKHKELIHKVHVEKKTFICNICNKTFRRKCQMRIHVSSVHEGIKPFKCESCGSSFKQKRSLVEHVKSVHEGIKTL